MKELDIIRKAFGSAKLPDRDSVYPPGVSAKAPKRGGNGRLALELAASGVLLVVMVLAVVIGPGLIRKDYVEPNFVNGEMPKIDASGISESNWVPQNEPPMLNSTLNRIHRYDYENGMKLHHRGLLKDVADDELVPFMFVVSSNGEKIISSIHNNLSLQAEKILAGLLAKKLSITDELAWEYVEKMPIPTRYLIYPDSFSEENPEEEDREQFFERHVTFEVQQAMDEIGKTDEYRNAVSALFDQYDYLKDLESETAALRKKMIDIEKTLAEKGFKLIWDLDDEEWTTTLTYCGGVCVAAGTRDQIYSLADEVEGTNHPNSAGSPRLYYTIRNPLTRSEILVAPTHDDKQVHLITYDLGSAAHHFFSMPNAAWTGETVGINADVLLDADIHVYVDGKEISKSHYYGAGYWSYVFVMPDKDVTVTARFYTKDEIWGTGNDELTVLKEKYPKYFGLSTSKGLDVYVWQMGPGSYSFGLLSGTNRDKTEEELMNLKGASAEEMKTILSSYGISENSVGIIPWQNPVSSYISDYWAVFQDEDQDSVAKRRGDYINGIREMLFGEAPIAFESKVAYANYTDDPKIHSCLNADKLTLDSEPHVPVFRFDTKGDLDKFRETFGDVLTFTYGYSEVPSFNEATAGYDDGFFADHTVILAYVGTVSGSFRFGVGGVSVSGSELCLNIVNLTGNLQQWTCDMAGWFVMAEFADEDIAGITDFDAIIEDGKVAKDWWLPQKSDTGAADGK
ncbi:MAG: hypothetical protein IJU75_04355 [Clostridia bacterium]|nr:hypothetical protein [Clostridia bacterium]